MDNGENKPYFQPDFSNKTTLVARQRNRYGEGLSPNGYLLCVFVSGWEIPSAGYAHLTPRA
ncbi:MAG: hypothetical protein LBU34_10820 [Planctomycetaceae bacterium]|nr:hypothetical protein [Planctomycetaceae bacterium]